MKRLVVARYQEDTSWTKKFSSPWRVLIVQKQTDKLQGDMPNAGREPASFLWSIVRLYDLIEPEDEFAFVQGNPFDHCPDLEDELSKPVTQYRGLGGTKHTDGQGRDDHHGLPVAKWYRILFGMEFPQEGVDFTPGGQFVTTGASIIKQPKGSYMWLLDEVSTGSVPYVMERLWGVLFS